MPHILEEFSKCCDTEISKPEICDHFFPIKYDNYIVIVCGNKKQSMSYIYWMDVVDLIKDKLSKAGVSIVQINQNKYPALKSTDLCLESISYQHIAYVIKNAKSVVSANGLLTHIASSYEVPCVSLHGEYYPSTCGPYWGDNNINLDAFSKDIKPCFESNDPYSLINKIKPETVADSILATLGIKTKTKTKSLFFGANYPNEVTEINPNFFNPNIIKPNTPINIRLDWDLNLQNAVNWSQNRKVNIFIDQQVDLKFFSYIKNSINQINFYVDENSSPEFLSLMESLGLKIKLFCKKNADKDKTRLNLLDHIVEENPNLLKKDIDFREEICENTFYKSSKIILSKNQFYSSYFSMKNNIPKNSSEEKVLDHPEFWEDKDHFYIFNK